MDQHVIEKKISSLVEQQFPSFYREEGPVFVQFVKAYYEYLEQEENVLGKARTVLPNTDIDDTLEKFLVYFQKKYLYGIPFNVIINKRFLLKHVLDAYRSKGSIQCYRLLFRLIYNQDIDVYLPGLDVLRVSDGTWIEPRFVEVTNVESLNDIVGKTIIGLSSNVQATVETCVTEPINSNLIAVLYISNITPKHGQFIIGEKLVDKTVVGTNQLTEEVNLAPTVIGSLDHIEVIDGGSNFKIGDTLKIAKRDLSNNNIISYGIEGSVRVSGTVTGRGKLAFNIANAGFGYTTSSVSFVYNNPADTTGSGAGFNIGSLSNIQTIEYNTDLICNYLDTQLDSTYGFPLEASANLSTNLASALSYTSDDFGSIVTLSNISTGSGYSENPEIFVYSIVTSQSLPGDISYTTAANTITGTGTEFERYFSNGDVITFLANSSNTSTTERKIIKQVVSNTSIILYDSPLLNSTATAVYKASPVILDANFAQYDQEVFQLDGSRAGFNANVQAVVFVGNSIVSNTEVVNSGRGYVNGETVTLYLSGGITTPSIEQGGSGYANNENLVFIGGDPKKQAAGYIQTDSNGTITTAVMTFNGVAYIDPPTIRVQTANGTGAILTTTVTEFNPTAKVTGRVVKTGIGRSRGYYSTTRGHISSDKYIQDSYYYQDFSYEIQAESTLNRYKDILYSTFHVSGTELFGKFLLLNEEQSEMKVLEESTKIDDFIGYTSDITTITCDNDNDQHSVDKSYILLTYPLISRFRADTSIFTSDNSTLTVDKRTIA